MPRLIYVAVLVGSVLAGILVSRALIGPESAPADTPPPAIAATPGATGGEFRLPDLAGELRGMDDWDGRIRLVNFWATWCAPCRREIPLLKEIQDSHGDLGIQVIGIAVDDAEPVAAYADEMAFNYPVLVGQEDAIAAGESFGIDFVGLPFTLVVARDGELLNVHVGELKREESDAMLDILQRLADGRLDKDAAREALAAI